MQDVELAADMVQQTILMSFHHNCPPRVALSPKRVLSWHEELTCIKTLTRQLFNRVTRKGNWESYKKALICYNKKIRQAQQSFWRDYCKGIEEVPDRARLREIMSSQPMGGIP